MSQRNVFLAVAFSVVAVGYSQATAGIFQVTTTNPANGSLVQRPASITVDFNQSIMASSVSDTDLTINGLSATGFTIVTSQEVNFSLPSLPTGDRVANTVDISGIQDAFSDTLMPFTETIFTDSVPPSVIVTSLAEGALVPAGPLTEVLTFSEPMDTALTNASDIVLHGVSLGVNYTLASFSWDPTGTQLTLNYSGLPGDNYTTTLFASGFADLVGLDLTSSGSVVNVASAPEPSSLLLLMAGVLGLGWSRRLRH